MRIQRVGHFLQTRIAFLAAEQRPSPRLATVVLFTTDALNRFVSFLFFYLFPSFFGSWLAQFLLRAFFSRSNVCLQ